VSLAIRAEGNPSLASLRLILFRTVPVVLVAAVIVGAVLWLLGSRNPYTPAGYVIVRMAGAAGPR
jgi:hypothetical protein